MNKEDKTAIWLTILFFGTILIVFVSVVLIAVSQHKLLEEDKEKYEVCFKRFAIKYCEDKELLFHEVMGGYFFSSKIVEFSCIGTDPHIIPRYKESFLFTKEESDYCRGVGE